MATAVTAAAVAASVAQSSSLSLSSSSSSLHILLIGIILPLFVTHCSFCKPTLFCLYVQWLVVVCACPLPSLLTPTAAAVAVAQSSSLSLSSSLSSLHVLLVDIVLPLFVTHCSFRRPTLARRQCAMFGCCLHLSAVLFVDAHRPAIADDCVVGRRPPAHLVASVSPAAGAFAVLRPCKAWSLRSSWHCCHR